MNKARFYTQSIKTLLVFRSHQPKIKNFTLYDLQSFALIYEERQIEAYIEMLYKV